jgi:hypothetical protein
MSVIRENSNPNSHPSSDDAEILEKFNIQSRQVVYFIVDDFRYTNLPDAVAAAKRRDHKASRP